MSTWNIAPNGTVVEDDLVVAIELQLPDATVRIEAGSFEEAWDIAKATFGLVETENGF